MIKAVKVVEVGARDGLQNEPSQVSLTDRYKLVCQLSDAGIKNIEVGAFVSPKWVPQMEGSKQLVDKILTDQKAGKLNSKTIFSALVPNVRGMEDALKTDLKEIAIFGSCSEAFSAKNINCSIDESFNRFETVVAMAKKNKIKVRGYLSMAFGCPYEGKVSQARVAKLANRMMELGVYEVSLGDTIRVVLPKQVNQLVKKVTDLVPLKKIAMHFHDTFGERHWQTFLPQFRMA
ncbi:MAG: hydroxymethylglutaryl-CoA lyase [Bdellovibrionales bacterium]